jgi:hypothetical protein
MFQTPWGKKLLSKDHRTLLCPIEIAEDYFLETYLSYHRIHHILKQLLETCGMKEDELKIHVPGS